MKLAIFTDYDGTITQQDTIDLALDTFGRSDWRAVSKRLDDAGAGNIERMTAEFDGFHATREGLKRLIRDNITIDEGFVRLVEYARRRGWPVVVLSQGVRESIETIFEKYGIEGVEYHANAFTGDDGTLALSYPEYRTISDGGCNDLCGVCKGGYIRAAGRSGFTTVYIGDGITDRCAAGTADIVFATKYLRTWMAEEGREHIAFEAFDEILSELQRRF